MVINSTLSITASSTSSSLKVNHMGREFVLTPADSFYDLAKTIYNETKSKPKIDRTAWVASPYCVSKMHELVNGLYGYTDTKEQNDSDKAEKKEVPIETPEEILKRGISQLMDFFTEFSFTPSFRFVNTLSRMETKEKAVDYICSYFSLMDNAYTPEIKNKVKSAEFNNIMDSILQYKNPKTYINTRFKVYYGSAGTGKTTLAQQESDNRCIVCNASMLPSDLMEDFTFKDGQPSFNPSILWECMEQGKPIVLDEINLLPFDSLRFLQGIVDGKTEFNYKNRPVHIKDGFCIIGTMNLTLGGMSYPLPEPLVDRCFEAREFTLTADQLMKAIVGD